MPVMAQLKEVEEEKFYPPLWAFLCFPQIQQYAWIAFVLLMIKMIGMFMVLGCHYFIFSILVKK